MKKQQKNIKLIKIDESFGAVYTCSFRSQVKENNNEIKVKDNLQTEFVSCLFCI